ncbi:MAG: hypothetical protein NE327_13620 [Lentisphaeraceae bacterium]|nr:hypothetical protein [Lentisphaeraceae bacterium]
MINYSDSRKSIKETFYYFLESEKQKLNSTDKKIIKMDVHCHDKNSDSPDELWGRILGLRETWIETEELMKVLYSNGTHALTITNHNNARSCWDLLEKGIDVLPAAEFTCHFREYNLYLHVLTYGLTPKDEAELNKKRFDIFKFLEYTSNNNLPTILPHPLYFYTRGKTPPFEAFEKLSLMFERFECLNGQRDIIQNSLAYTWIRGLNTEKLERLSKKHGISPGEFCRNPYKKSFSGGSDDHLALYAGSCGTVMAVDSCRNIPLSQLALEAIRNGDIAPYGKVANGDRLSLTFLDYFCQVVLNMEDPGMVRLMLHKGEWKDKISCLFLGNLFLEMQSHKGVHKIMKMFHNALHGRKPDLAMRIFAPRVLKKCLVQLSSVADSRKRYKSCYESKADDLMLSTFRELSSIIAGYVENFFSTRNSGVGRLLEQFELPIQLSKYFNARKKIEPSIEELGISGLVTLIFSTAKISASRALNNGRDFLNNFSKQLTGTETPQKLLFYVEDFFENSPRGKIFRTLHKLSQKQKLPVEFITCSPSNCEIEGVIILKPVKSIKIADSNAVFHIPDLFELHELFRKDTYDQVMSCGSLISSFCTFFLKECFVVNAHIFVTRNWVSLLTRKLNLKQSQQSRLKRVIRFYYRQFSSMFVTRMSTTRYLCSKEMNLNRNNVIGLDFNSESECLSSLYLILNRLGISSGQKQPFQSTLLSDIYNLAIDS